MATKFVKGRQAPRSTIGAATAVMVLGGALFGGGVLHAQGPKPAATAAGAKTKPLPVGILDMTGDHQTKIRAIRSPRGPWVPEFEVVAHIPNLAPEDVLMATFKRGRKKLGEPFACKPRETLVDYQRRNNTPKHRVDLAYFQCKFPEQYAQNKAGDYEVALAYKRTLEGKEESLGSLYLSTFDIKQGSQNKQTTLQETLQDGPMGVATMYEASAYAVDGHRRLPAMAESFVREQLGDQYTDSTFLKLKVRTKNDEGDGNKRYEAICFHGSQRIGTRAMSGSQTDRFKYWTFAGKDKKRVSWTDRVFQLNHLRVRHRNNRGKPNNNPNWWYLDEHPGKYECKIVEGGQIRGVAHFVVHDGRVMPHKCTDEIQAPDHVAVINFEDKGMSDLKPNKKHMKRVFGGPRTWSKACPPTK